LPVSLVIESDPTACQFTIAQIDIYDSGGRKVYSKPGINATTADLPKLPAGDYDVFVVPSPAVTAQVGNPYAGGTARIYESCAGKTLLYIANVNFPTPQFDLEVT